MISLLKILVLLVIPAIAGRLIARGVFLCCRPRIMEAEDAPWPEKARLLFSFVSYVRTAPVVFFLLFTSPLLGYAVSKEEWLVWPVMLAGMLGHYAVSLPLKKRAWKILNYRPLTAGELKGDLVRRTGYAVLLGIFLTLQEPEWSWRTAAVATAAMVSLMVWGIVTLDLGGILRGHRVPVPERLQRIVSEAAAQAGVAMPKIMLVDGDIANAAAMPLNRRIVASTALLELLDDDELAAVIRHELGHLNDGGGTAMMILLTPLLFLPLFVIRPLAESLRMSGAWLAFVLWLVVTLRLYNLLSRSRERHADKDASISDPAALARALEKMYRRGCIPAVMKISTTHPDLWTRLEALNIVPDWPRPAPVTNKDANEAYRSTAIISLLALGAALVVILLRWENTPASRDNSRHGEIAPYDGTGALRPR
jgi:Zn-dependent protease with chaperone function